MNFVLKPITILGEWCPLPFKEKGCPLPCKEKSYHMSFKGKGPFPLRAAHAIKGVGGHAHCNLRYA